MDAGMKVITICFLVVAVLIIAAPTIQRILVESALGL